jgi:hypothetical protein
MQTALSRDGEEVIGVVGDEDPLLLEAKTRDLTIGGAFSMPRSRTDVAS